MTRAGRPSATRSRFRDGLVHGTVDGARAAWLAAGPTDGLPLVVLHGAGLDRAGTSWCRLLPRLAESRPVLAPDLPGHGGTPALGTFRGVADLAAWVASFLDTVGIGRAALAGVSMGGAIALRVALDMPGRVAGVVPVASYGLTRRARLHPLLHAGTRLPIARMTDPLVARSPLAARLALRTLVHHPAAVSEDMVIELREIAAEMQDAHTFDRFLDTEVLPTGFRTFLLDDLDRLTVPAHFIHGVHDTVVPIDGARDAARRTGSPLTEIDAGHWPMFEAPEACLAAMEPFLETLQP